MPPIFDEYLALIEARIEAAREAGTLDLGLETIKVDSCRILADQLLRIDPLTGAETRLLSLEIERHLRPLRFERLSRLHDVGSVHAVPLHNARSGRVALSVPRAPSYRRRWQCDRAAAPAASAQVRQLDARSACRERLGGIDPVSFERHWRAEETEAVKEPVRERVHLATGLMLPVWKRLPGEHVRVTRIVSPDGTSIIGR